MRNTTRFSGSLLAVVCLAMMPIAASAAYVAVDTFDGLELGPVDGQNGWTAGSSASTVALDPGDGDNRILSIVTDSTYLRKGALLPDEMVRMLFLRFRYADQLNFSLGMSEYAYPYQIGDFDPELNMTNAPGELRVNDGGQYEVIGHLEPATWYNCWLMIDNAANETRIWLHDRDGDRARAEDQLVAEGDLVFAFRTSRAGDLKNVFIKTGGGTGLVGPLYLDDIYLETGDGINLENPTASATPVIAVPQPVPTIDVHPNPFNPLTTVSFVLEHRLSAEIGVYGVAGDRVAVIHAGELGPGSHAFAWRGCDDRGRSLASGSYIVRLDSAHGTQAKMITLIR